MRLPSDIRRYREGGRVRAAIRLGCKLFACEVVKNASAGIALEKMSGHPRALGL